MKKRLKQLIFRLMDKDPEGVVVTFWSGDSERAGRMFREVRELMPDRRHFVVCTEAVDVDGAVMIRVGPRDPYLHLRRELARFRIAIAPVLFTEDSHPLRAIAFAIAPTKILAYNRNLERHHLRLRTAVASLLFFRGMALDRIFLRPSWLYPFKRDRTRIPEQIHIVDGRLRGKPRVAVLSPYFPYPLTHGGAVRIFHLIREAAREFDVFLFTFARDSASQEYGLLRELCARIVVAEPPHYREPRWSTLRPPEVGEYECPPLRECIEQMRRQDSIDLLQVEYTQLGAYDGDILVEHDITQDLYRQVWQKQQTIAAWWNWFRWKRFENRVLPRFKRVVAMSEKDADWIGPRSVVIENGVDLERFYPEREPERQNLLFVGSFNHFPNVEAFRFFYDNVWPVIQRRNPELTWTVVAGRDHQTYWRQFTGDAPLPSDRGLEMLDFVRDVRPLYVQATIVVVPTIVSAGTNLKVLEAMAMERAIVSTPSGCAGIGLVHGESVWIASGAQEFASAIERLLGEPDLRRKLTRNARLLAEKSYDWKALGQKQCRLWKELMQSPDVTGRGGEP